MSDKFQLRCNDCGGEHFKVLTDKKYLITICSDCCSREEHSLSDFKASVEENIGDDYGEGACNTNH